MTEPESGDEDITWKEVLYYLEFGCWAAIVLIPGIYYIQGPSVSYDQSVMRSIVVGIAVLGAPVLMLVRRWCVVPTTSDAELRVTRDQDENDM